MTLAPKRLAAPQDDIDGVMRAASDYLEGWFGGDAERHARAYHPECLKRIYEVDDWGVARLNTLTPQMMEDYVRTGRTVHEDCETEIVIDAIAGDVASVRAYSCLYVDFLHVVRARGEWRLLNVTYHRR